MQAVRCAANPLLRAIAVDASLGGAHYYPGLSYARLGRQAESTTELELASKLEREDLNQQRVLMKLLDSSPPDAAPGDASSPK